VAQHSSLVEAIISHLEPATARQWRLAGLLHDAPEYVIGDMISPFKAAVGLDYKAFEKRLLSAIHIRFGVPANIPQRVEQLIKRADRIAAYLEATQLAGFGIKEAHKFFGVPRGLTGDGSIKFHSLKPLAPTEASAQYLRKFKQLQ
jgi:hypothetical protein